MMATHEFVVPRSMPMILPMFFLLACGPEGQFRFGVGYLWISCGVSSAAGDPIAAPQR
jgi:hypothetical protein